MKRNICALTLCLALLAGLLTPTALAAGEKPAFPQQPQSTTVTAPDTAVFTAQATGDPTYQWQAKDESGWLDILGATRSTYTIRNTATAMNGRQYRCQATNASGTTYSGTVTLTVKKGPDYVPPALKPITERVIHLPAPKTGGKMYYVFPQENDQYGAIFSWNRSVDPEEGFEPGLDYVLYLDLSAKNGYTLDGLTPDFFLVPGAEKVELSEEFGRPRLTITWPITSGEHLYGVSATTTNPSWTEPHGALSLSTNEAKAGTTVILTATRDKNFVVKSAVYKEYDPQANQWIEHPCTSLGNGKYSFVVKNDTTAYVTFYNPSLPTLDYEDIVHDWQKNPVYFVSTKGYMTGIEDGYFGPEGGMTRAMVATILYRMAGAPAVANAQTGFEDVDAAAWYGPAVAWAKEKGMINGYSPTQFAPDDYISREQMAALLWRYAGSPAPTQALTATDQDSISDWAKSAMAWASEKGMFNAPSAPTKLQPTAYAFRIDMAVMLWHYYGAPLYKAN